MISLNNGDDNIHQMLGLIKSIYIIESSSLIKLNLVNSLSKLLKRDISNGKDMTKLQIIDFLLYILKKEKGNFKMTSKIVDELINFEIVYNFNKKDDFINKMHDKYTRMLCKHILGLITDDRIPMNTLITSLIFMSYIVRSDWLKVNQVDTIMCLEDDKVNVLVDVDAAKEVRVFKVDGDDGNLDYTDRNDDIDDGGKENDDGGEHVINDLFSGITKKTSTKKKEDFKFEVLDKNEELINMDDLLTEILYKIEIIIEKIEQKIEENQEASSKSFLGNEYEVILVLISGFFIAYPAVYQHLLGRIFEIFHSSEDPFLKLKSLYFNIILNINSKEFENIVNSILKIV